MASKNSSKAVLYAIAAVLIVVIVLVMIVKSSSTEPKTIRERFEDLEGGRQEESSYSYNGFSFVFQEGLWYTQLMRPGASEAYTLPLHYGPRQIENVTVYGEVKEYIMGVIAPMGKVYVTFDPGNTNLGWVAVANAELSASMIQVMKVQPIISCTNNSFEACRDVPLITCRNTLLPVIYLKEGGKTKVSLDMNCITIQGDRSELLRALDRFLYVWYGIMDEE